MELQDKKYRTLDCLKWKKYDYSVQSHSSTCDETKEDE